MKYVKIIVKVFVFLIVFNVTSFSLENKILLKINNKILPFKKVIEVDSDKSLSIRSFLIGSISQNISIVKNSLE